MGTDQIRRRSETRSHTFTMVLDPEYPGGRAIVVPCRSHAGRFEDLLQEAEALWMAERNAESPAGISAAWGSVGALFAPDSAAGLQKEWAARFTLGAVDGLPIDERGNLRIDWPRRCADDSDVDLDVILATATLPEPTGPTAEEIANAWADQSDGAEQYFIANVRNGIRTPDDLAIWCHLEERNPPWLDQALHQELGGLLGS